MRKGENVRRGGAGLRFRHPGGAVFAPGVSRGTGGPFDPDGGRLAILEALNPR